MVALLRGMCSTEKCHMAELADKGSGAERDQQEATTVQEPTIMELDATKEMKLT